jgi:L-iditol 2-dehydrogenase
MSSDQLIFAQLRPVARPIRASTIQTGEVMKSARLSAPFTIEFEDVELGPLAPGQVRLRVHQCGICSSEIGLWTGQAGDPYPAPIGHEFAGVVEAVGAGVTDVGVGDHVAAWVPEGGGFAEQAVVEARHCVPVLADSPYPAVAEPLACCVNAVELADPALADDVVIVGAGFMSNLIQLLSVLKGARTITVADVRPDVLDRARDLGATHVVNSADESLADVVARVTDGRGADVTYEVTGVGPGLVLAGEVTRMGGKLCIVGYHQGAHREIPLGHWNWMALDLRNAHFRSIETIMRGMRSGMRLVDAGVLDPSVLVTHTFPLVELAEGFAMATAKPDGFTKAVVLP